MSPVSTATRVSGGKPSRVLSSRVVLPEPGELTRLMQRTWFAAKRSRRESAMRWFSLRTLDCKGTCVMVFFHFQVVQFQFVATGERGLRTLAGGAFVLEIPNTEQVTASQATLAARHRCDLQFQCGPIRLQHQSGEAEIESLRIHARQFANAHADSSRHSARAFFHFRGDGVEYRLSDTHFMHEPEPCADL